MTVSEAYPVHDELVAPTELAQSDSEPTPVKLPLPISWHQSLHAALSKARPSKVRQAWCQAGFASARAASSRPKLRPASANQQVVLRWPDISGFFRHRRAGWSSDAITRSEFLLRELLLGVVVCMAQIPESIAFAYLARVRPPVALHSAWIVGLVCALGGGRPGMINGATGAFAAIIATFLEEPEVEGGNGAGIETLFPSVIVAGLLMLGVCYFRLDRFVALLPLPVMIGFCNGLAVVIGRAQLHPFYAP